MTNSAPGWYPDPGQPESQRYWDGQTWTADTASRRAPVASVPSDYREASQLVDNKAARYGLTFAIVGCLLVVFAVPGLVLGIVGLKKAEQVGGLKRKSAIWAVVLSAISLTYAVTRFLVEYRYGH